MYTHIMNDCSKSKIECPNESFNIKIIFQFLDSIEFTILMEERYYWLWFLVASVFSLSLNKEIITQQA